MKYMDAPGFKQNIPDALADVNLRESLSQVESGFVARRKAAVENMSEFESLRDRGRELKDHALDNLDFYLELFEKNCTEAGGHVHWASTTSDARNAILDICKNANAKTVTKGKSMVAEEIHLNSFLEANNITPVETDLGEYIIQLAEEPPSHIIAPAMHKTKDQVSDLFLKHHAKLGLNERQTEPEKLIDEARQVLRQKYYDADVGITGANFLIAETGSSIIVTNEGNGDLTQLLGKVHIVITTIEKVMPTLEDVSTVLRLLARSATGQEFSAYTSFSTGPKRPEDLDGPEEFHVVILDNGRSSLLGTDFQEMLRCIKCGACMNHCPVYQSVGGHTYGTVYVGPMGSVLSPALEGISTTRHLPNASTFCGRCESVCPMKIPLPKLLRRWREISFETGQAPMVERYGIQAWAWLAKIPWLYGPATRVAARGLAWAGRDKGRIRKMPLMNGWTNGRDFPAPEGDTFQAQWAKKRGKGAGRLVQ
jgi:L-lactate dehydrogenase complex protein LldF